MCARALHSVSGCVSAAAARPFANRFSAGAKAPLAACVAIRKVSPKPQEQRRADNRRVCHLDQGRTQGEQMAREIPAVDRRDVARQQRRERLRVVPVVEVTAVPFHRLHRSQCMRGPVDELAARDISEVARGHVGEKREPHVGRRRPMRDGRDGMLLEIVRRQPMIVGADKGFEECSTCGARSRAESGSARPSGARCARTSGRLIHQATAGEAVHSSNRGSAAKRDAGATIAMADSRSESDRGTQATSFERKR